jgi:integrase
MRVPKLTRAIVTQAKPAAPGCSYYIMDSSLPGFGLRVYPKASYYVVRFRRKPYTLGPSLVLTLEEARKSARNLLSRLWSGERIGASLPVADLFAQYIAATESRKRALTNTNESRLWRIHILPALGPLPVSDLTRERVSEWHRSMSETPASANRALSLLRTAVRWGEKSGALPKGSSDGIVADAFAEYPRERTLSADELTRLFVAIDEAEAGKIVHPELASVIRLMVRTGARPSELLGARSEWVDYERGAILLPYAKGDRAGRKKGRAIWLGPKSLEIVRQFAGSGPLFPSVCPESEEDRRGYQKLQRAWLQVCRIAGIKDASPYCTRHTFVSRGARAGVGIEGSSDLVGHATLETTKRIYHHGEDAMHQKNIAAMEADLDALLDGVN